MKFNYPLTKSGCRDAPQFGAIFMSDSRTKEECLQRKLFGLPSAYADFVKKVKAGMVLFLFEFEQRKLYGFFQATSDGAMSIIPNAYGSLGKQYRAQVLFTTIWDCHPLHEHDFCDAIKENYYAPSKFNVGLSKDQVRRLLWLFSSQKIKIQKAGSLIIKAEVKQRQCKCSEEANSSVFYDELLGENDHFMFENQHRSCCSMSLGDPIVSIKTPETTFFSFEEFATEGSLEPLPPSEGQSAATSVELNRSNISPCDKTTDLGDYIPLPSSSSEHSDSSEAYYAEENQDFIPLSSSEISNSMKDDYAGSNQDCISLSPPGHPFILGVCDDENIPRVSLTFEGGSHEKGGSFFFGSEGINCQKHGDLVSHNDSIYGKGLYSDSPDRRASVFSRLNLDSTFNKQENMNNGEIVLSMSDIVSNLQHRHINWEETIEKDGSMAQKNVQDTPRKRNSVFTRLSFASSNVIPEKEVKIADVTVRLNCSSKKKTLQDCLVDLRSHDYEENTHTGTQMMIKKVIPAGVWDPNNRWNNRVKQSSISNFECKTGLKKQHRVDRICFIDRAEGDKAQKREKIVPSILKTRISDSITCDDSGQLPSQKKVMHEIKVDGRCKASTCPSSCHDGSREEGQISDEELKLGELEIESTYQPHHDFPSLSIKALDKDTIVDRENAESHEVSMELVEKSVDGIDVRRGTELDVIQC